MERAWNRRRPPQLILKAENLPFLWKFIKASCVCTCVLRVLRAMLATVARHARVHDVSTLHRTYVRRAPAASAAAPALRRPIPRRPASRLGHSAGAFGALHSRHARLGVRRALRAMMLARMRVMAAQQTAAFRGRIPSPSEFHLAAVGRATSHGKFTWTLCRGGRHHTKMRS